MPVLCHANARSRTHHECRHTRTCTQVPEPVGVCAKGDVSACSCAVTVSHFSTFGVVDKAVAYEPRTVVAQAATTPAPTSELSSATCVRSSFPACLWLAAGVVLAGSALVRI